jgi:hypothetical protein
MRQSTQRVVFSVSQVRHVSGNVPTGYNIYVQDCRGLFRVLFLEIDFVICCDLEKTGSVTIKRAIEKALLHPIHAVYTGSIFFSVSLE